MPSGGQIVSTVGLLFLVTVSLILNGVALGLNPPQPLREAHSLWDDQVQNLDTANVWTDIHFSGESIKRGDWRHSHGSSKLRSKQEGIIVMHFSVQTEVTMPPTNAPTPVPTPVESDPPTTKPTSAPTLAPTEIPTPSPTRVPTSAPTQAPTANPTTKPSAAPTQAPTMAPTTKPTASPTHAPTQAPSPSPTEPPTPPPTFESPPEEPTEAPTQESPFSGASIPTACNTPLYYIRAVRQNRGDGLFVEFPLSLTSGSHNSFLSKTFLVHTHVNDVFKFQWLSNCLFLVLTPGTLHNSSLSAIVTFVG